MTKHKKVGNKHSIDEKDLRRSEEHMRLILESTKRFAIFSTGTDGIINYWSQYVGERLPDAQRKVIAGML